MPAVITSEDIKAFMEADDNAAARLALGVPSSEDAEITDLTATGTVELNSSGGNDGAGMTSLVSPVSVLEVTATTNDATYQTLDLSSYVPPGAVQVVMQWHFYLNDFTADAAVQLRVRSVGDYRAGGNDPGQDGSRLIAMGTNATTYIADTVTLRVGSDRKVQYRRVNPSGRSLVVLASVIGWVGGPSQPIVGAAGVLVAWNAGNENYPSFPWAYRTRAGNRLVAFRAWDGTNPCDHSAGGASWLIRNEGSPVLKWSADGLNGSTATADGEIVQDTFIFQVPGSATVVFFFRTDGLVENHFSYALSTNEGVTFAAPVESPAFEDIPDDPDIIGFFDFLETVDGETLLATVWLAEDGEEEHHESVAIMESTDGITWAFRSWAIQSSTDNVGASEACMIRLAGGRIVLAARNSVNTLSPGDGYTCYSDDEGETWTAPVQQTGCNWAGQRGIALTSSTCAVFGRSGNNQVYWILDESGTLVWGPVKIFTLSASADGGYGAFIEEPTGRYYYHYSDLFALNGNGPNLCKTPVAIRRRD